MSVKMYSFLICTYVQLLLCFKVHVWKAENASLLNQENARVYTMAVGL